MSDLVGNPEDWFSHNEAQIIIGIIEKKKKKNLISRAAKSNGADQPAHHKNAAETKTKGAATSYDSHGGIWGPFFITLPRPCNIPPLQLGFTGVYIFS